MLYKRLFINVLVRVIFIAFSSLILAYAYIKAVDIITMINIFAFIILQLGLLIWKLNRINRDLQWFFASLKNEDSSIIYSKRNKEKHLNKIYESFDEVNSMIGKIKLENASQNQYFQHLVQHVNIGIIVFYSDDTVEIINNAAQKMLNISALNNIQSLDAIHTGFSRILRELRPSEQKLLKLVLDGKTINLSLKISQIKFDQIEKKILTLQNINNELDEKELDSWHKLIRVLTHEIMNSTAPISSSIKLIAGYYKDEKTNLPKPAPEIDDEVINNTIRGLRIIEERSEGLIKFVNKYRDLTSLPPPDYSKLNISELFQNCRFLLKEKLEQNNIELIEKIIPTDLFLEADKELVEQIIINMLNNSVFALNGTKNKTIEVTAYLDDDERVNISIVDNGCGISEEEIDKVFIPFYSTNKMGSGIGLSLSRQIMRLHGGTISVRSIPGTETEFVLRF
ncbi:PAS domain-containing sensor histidine kinase [Bacteroidota bacterium]